MIKEINILGKRIVLSECETLFTYNSQDPHFENYFDVKMGKWYHDGKYLIGEETGNNGGIIFTNKAFTSDILVSARLATCLPATRDLNLVWCSNWDRETNYLGDSYVCGLNGWYDNLSGIERSGKNGFYTSTSLYTYEKGTFVNIICGSINGHCFLVVDDVLISEIIDSFPLKGGYAGISPYCTKLKIESFEVKKIAYHERKQKYDPEF